MSPPKNAFINSKISEALGGAGFERQNSNGSLALETPKTKPVVANANFFFIGGFDCAFEAAPRPQSSSIFGERHLLSPKLQELAKAVDHYLNGEYDKVEEEEEKDIYHSKEGDDWPRVGGGLSNQST